MCSIDGLSFQKNIVQCIRSICYTFVLYISSNTVFSNSYFLKLLYCDSLVFVSGGDVRLEFAAIDDWIAHTAVRRLHVDAQTHAALQAALWAALHLLPQLQVLRGRCRQCTTETRYCTKQSRVKLYGKKGRIMKGKWRTEIAAFGFHLLVAFTPHRLRVCVVHIGISFWNELLAVLLNQVEVIRCARLFVVFNAQLLQILKYSLN